MTNNRTIYYDILRIIATLAVITIHVCAQDMFQIPVGTYRWNVINVYYSISRWAAPMFVMISGGLFLAKDRTIKEMYSKYIFRIVTAFIFWSLFYAGSIMMVGASRKDIIESIFTGNYHMWFLFMIVGMYMLTPLLRKIVTDDLLIKYFLELSFVFAVFLPQLIKIVGLFSGYYSEYIANIIKNLDMYFVMGYSFYFVLGYYISTHTINNKIKTIIYLLGGVCFITTIIGSYIVTARANKIVEIFYDTFSINIFGEILFVFILIKDFSERIVISENVNRILSQLSKYTFGAYLVHAFIIRVLYRIGLTALTFNPVVSIPVIVIAVFIISMIISKIISCIPVANRLIV